MKHSLRKSILEKRNSLSQKEVIRLSAQIKERLFSTKEYLSAKTVMFYVSFNNEVYTHDMIVESFNKKIVFVPKILKGDIVPHLIKSFDELAHGTHKILEPKTDNIFDRDKIDLIIVPAIAFDLHGHRIGYGKGYYDRFLKTVKAYKIGLAFDLQIIEKVPNHPDDVPVDKVISEKRVIEH